jgi:hypothetical protein
MGVRWGEEYFEDGYHIFWRDGGYGEADAVGG